MTTDHAALTDLVAFARFEVDSHDVAPWADVLRDAVDSGGLLRETAQWVTTLYNTYDDFGSAFRFAARWPSLPAWVADPDRWEAADRVSYPILQERRNLHGGKVVRRLSSYAELVGDATEEAWLMSGAVGATPAERFDTLCAHVRQVWGVGRQAAFEWAEFQGKVLAHDVMAGHAFLWESEGPRRSLQRLYGVGHPTSQWLDERAEETQELLVRNDVYLPIWDFETVICDFHVMRHRGRYYLGKHLAALREEIELVPEPAHTVLLDSWHAVIPPPWNRIAPGVDKTLLKTYQLTGRMAGPFRGEFSCPS